MLLLVRIFHYKNRKQSRPKPLQQISEDQDPMYNIYVFNYIMYN